jgi:hypothetical protein
MLPSFPRNTGQEYQELNSIIYPPAPICPLRSERSSNFSESVFVDRLFPWPSTQRRAKNLLSGLATSGKELPFLGQPKGRAFDWMNAVRGLIPSPIERKNKMVRKVFADNSHFFQNLVVPGCNPFYCLQRCRRRWWFLLLTLPFIS